MNYDFRLAFWIIVSHLPPHSSNVVVVKLHSCQDGVSLRARVTSSAQSTNRYPTRLNLGHLLGSGDVGGIIRSSV
jgi:hypothetical protein